MDHPAAIDDIRDVAESLLSDGNEKGLLGLANHSTWVVKIQQSGANTVLATLEKLDVRVDFDTRKATKPLNNIPDSVLLSRREKAGNDPPWLGR
jgi:hypothetical protein